MRCETVITKKALNTRFYQERDVVTLSPYHIGDRVVRCASCRVVVKSEFVAGACPICGHAPFLPALVAERSLTAFLCLLLLAGAGALLPFAIPPLGDLLDRATFGPGVCCDMVCIGIIGLLAALLTYRDPRSKRMWQVASRGVPLLLLIPFAAPWLLLAAVRILPFVLPVLPGVLCIAIAIGILVFIIS